jgi:perosamine synthetase
MKTNSGCISWSPSIRSVLLSHGLIDCVSLPVTESLSTRGLYIPSGLGLSDADQSKVIDAVSGFVAKYQ